MINKYTGEVTVQIGGKDYILKYDWSVLAEIQSEMGLDTIFQLYSQPTKILAPLVAHGLKARHPEMTAQVINELSPPILPMQKAVDLAIRYAYYGPQEIEEVKKNSSGIRKAISFLGKMKSRKV